MMPFAWKALKALPALPHKRFFLLVTMNQSGDISRHAVSTLGRRGWECRGALEVSFPNNVVVGSPDPHGDTLRIELARGRIAAYAASLARGELFFETAEKGSRLVSLLARTGPLPWIAQR